MVELDTSNMPYGILLPGTGASLSITHRSSERKFLLHGAFAADEHSFVRRSQNECLSVHIIYRSG